MMMMTRRSGKVLQAQGGSQTMQTHLIQKEPQADPECKLSRQMFHLGVSAPEHAY